MFLDDKRQYDGTMGRKKESNQELETHSDGKLRTYLSDWVVNAHDREDFGFDYEVRIVRNDLGYNEVSSSNFYIQLKASESFESNSYVYSDLDTDYLIDNCLTTSIPVLLMVYERDSDDFFWTEIHQYCWNVLDESKKGWRDQKTVRIKIDRDQSLNSLGGKGILHYNIDKAQEEIAFRRTIWMLDDETELKPNNRPEVTNKEIEEFKRSRLEEATRFEQKGDIEQANKIYEEIYKLPSSDKYKLLSIYNLCKNRNVVTSEDAFRMLKMCEEGIELFDNLNQKPRSSKDITQTLKEGIDHSKSIIKSKMPGSRYYHEELMQEFLVLDLYNLTPERNSESAWIADIQYQDGDLYDENAAAVAMLDEYSLVECRPEYYPMREACEEGEHNINESDLRRRYDESGSGPVLCQDCNLSLQVIGEALCHDTPFVCASCDQIVYEMGADLLCKECA